MFPRFCKGSSPFMGRWRAAPEGLTQAPSPGFARKGSSPFMGRWRVAPEGLTQAPSPGFAGYFPASGEEHVSPFLQRLLPIHGEVARSAGGADAGPIPRLRQERLLPIHGEVARSAGGADAGPIPRLRRVLPRKRGRACFPVFAKAPPHSWGGGAQRRRG